MEPSNQTAAKQAVTVYEGGRFDDKETCLIAEEPLSIRIEGRPYAVIMRSPGRELDHAAGFCLSEGLLENLQDIQTMGYCTEAGVNVVTVTLADHRRESVAELLDRRGFVSQTSCGLCGKAVIQDMLQITAPLPLQNHLAVSRIFENLQAFPGHQELHRQTRSAHAAQLFAADGAFLCAAEDVGRHNALDKAIGCLLRAGQLEAAVMGIMSSRLSYELVQKAARAGLEILVGISRPTLLGVELAAALNMTLVCVKNDSLMIFSGAERVVGAGSR